MKQRFLTIIIKPTEKVTLWTKVLAILILIKPTKKAISWINKRIVKDYPTNKKDSTSKYKYEKHRKLKVSRKKAEKALESERAKVINQKLTIKLLTPSNTKNQKESHHEH